MEQSELVETNGLENRHALCRRILQDLTIMNDMFMRNVFKKRECTEYVLQVILQQKDLKVVEQVIQKDFKNLQGRISENFPKTALFLSREMTGLEKTFQSTTREEKLKKPMRNSETGHRLSM